MANHKDIAVKTGTYTDAQGNTKSRYENVGKLMQGNDGPYILLKRTFNPAGVTVETGRDMLVLSIFDAREPGQQRNTEPAPQTAAPTQASSFPDDDIPF